MRIIDYLALGLAAIIFILTAGVAIYKWAKNTKADFSPRDEK